MTSSDQHPRCAMPSFHQHLDVSYQISLHATRDCFAPDNDTLVQAMEAHAGGRPVRALVYIDEGALMHDIHLAQRVNGWFTNHRSAGVEIATEPEVVMGGEALKDDMAILDKIGLATFNHGLCRHSYIIVIGDEAVLEAVGFAASLIHRGIRQIRMPTSAIAQCRTGRRIGNGVNRFGSRNYYGTSTPPRAIINDSRFLENVDDCSWKAVISEAVRMAVIDNHGLLGEMWERINLMHG